MGVVAEDMWQVVAEDMWQVVAEDMWWVGEIKNKAKLSPAGDGTLAELGNMYISAYAFRSKESQNQINIFKYKFPPLAS